MAGINRVRKLLRGNRTNTEVLENIVVQMQEIRGRHEILALAPDNTGYNWLGIKRGAIALFADNLVCLPQYYSNSILSEVELEDFAEHIVQLGFKLVVLRGFPPYFEGLIRMLKSLNVNIKIVILYGGFLAENAVGEDFANNFLKIIELKKIGIIDGLGFNKNGLSNTVNKLYGIRTFSYYNKTHIYSDITKSTQPDIHVGVLADSEFRKNIDNQVAASLLIPGSYVHTMDNNRCSYLDLTGRRIIVHEKMEHRDFTELLATMTLNMYVSFSESWGHIITESMAYGIPCLASYTSSIFDHNDFLRDRLVVSKLDDSYEISLKAMKVMEEYEQICVEGMRYVRELNDMADKIMTDSLGQYL